MDNFHRIFLDRPIQKFWDNFSMVDLFYRQVSANFLLKKFWLASIHFFRQGLGNFLAENFWLKKICMVSVGSKLLARFNKFFGWKSFWITSIECFLDRPIQKFWDNFSMVDLFYRQVSTNFLLEKFWLASILFVFFLGKV